MNNHNHNNNNNNEVKQNGKDCGHLLIKQHLVKDDRTSSPEIVDIISETRKHKYGK